MPIGQLGHHRHGHSGIRKADVVAQCQKTPDCSPLLLGVELGERSRQVAASASDRCPTSPVVPVGGGVSAPGIGKPDEELLDQDSIVEDHVGDGLGHY